VPVKSDKPDDLLVDWEMGGVGLSDPSQGLEVKLWTARISKHDDGSGDCDIIVSAPGVADTILISGNAITEVSLAFDQNMKPAIAYVEAGVSKLWWYDATIQATSILTIDGTTPRITLDDHRIDQVSVSDIILAYISAGNLCYRQQRDRFQTERVLKTVGAGAQLVSVTMNNVWRLQFHVHNMTVPADDQTQVFEDPFLADIVSDLCKRADVQKTALDVSELYDDRVPGYGLSTDDGVNEYLKPLAQVFTFDPTEFDRKIHFFKRGRAAVMGISFDDLVATGDDSKPMKITLADKTKLPKTVNVSYTDPTGGYATNKQYAVRRSNQINTDAKQDINLNMTLQPDQAAQFAEITLKVNWNELMTYDWQLPLKYTMLTPGDVFDYFDEDGNTQRIRITSRNEADDVLKFEGKSDGGALCYSSKRVGLPLPYPKSTTPGLVGETRLEILNIPVINDLDDELGVMIAVAGSSTAWFGAQVLFSTDGVNYAEAMRTEVPSTLGDTTTELLAELSTEYPSDQSVTVTSNFPLSSISDDELQRYGNLCVIGDEVLQFQNAAYLGNDTYQLSGLVRGRYNTAPDHWPVGTRFVLLDSAVMFVQAQRYMLGQEIWFKPVSFGVTDDESVPTTYEFDTALSQQEWPPTDVVASRDGSNNVAVSWTARPRLGVEISPHQSKYFDGYLVRFSDGFTATTDATAYTRADTPAGVTVAVCGVNAITGNGPFTEETAT
jgi:hypothetical protein